MQLDLDNFFKETTERLYNRLVRAYNIRMISANDKEYSHQQYVDYCNATMEFKFQTSDFSSIIEIMEHEFKLGKKFENGIKKVRQAIETESCIQYIGESKTSNNPSDESAIFTDFIEMGSVSKVESKSFLTELSDSEIIRFFAEYKAFQRFSLFLSSQNQREKEEIDVSEIPEKSKDFTTARQVLAVHYLLKYTQVKNVDKTEIARFIQFLTGKNYDNIYKKLQNPFKINEKFLNEDLRFIRDYFERLGMSEVVRMINGEMG